GTDHQADQESFAAVNRAQGNPEAPITIYRAEPETVTAINRGDWVTPSLTYAREHLDANLGGEGHIVSATARAGDLRWSGDSINEWGYSGVTTSGTTVRKYSPDQERDERGRFAGGGGSEAGSVADLKSALAGLDVSYSEQKLSVQTVGYLRVMDPRTGQEIGYISCDATTPKDEALMVDTIYVDPAKRG